MAIEQLPGPELLHDRSGKGATARTYDVSALELAIYFNREGDHDHNGLLFALTKNVPILEYIAALQSETSSGLTALYAKAKLVADELKVAIPDVADLDQARREARQPHPLVRPLVLRANLGDNVEVVLRNRISGRRIGLHLIADGYAVRTDDGSAVGANPDTLVNPGATRTYRWHCAHEGVFPFHDAGNYSGGQDGTNVHGLFGALVVEPPGAIWRDPVTGRTSVTGELDGLYLDVIPSGVVPPDTIPTSTTTLADHVWPAPQPYACFGSDAHREFVVFFHDEPEFVPPHTDPPVSPCARANGAHGETGETGETGEAGNHGGAGSTHGGGDELLPIMPVSYRAEPMMNREHTLWGLLDSGHVLERPVLNEEQHHSSWMFGDPATPILKAYTGDPVRIRFVHAGVKETHVFHLHLYEWHAVPQDQTSPRIDAISVSPQTAHTIEPVWGAGNRHQIAGDVIWHCHLYPHFHEGMWGMFRTFETLQLGADGALIDSSDPVYAGRRIGRYPDGTRIERLLPLPGRALPPNPTPTRPGYPLYIPGKVQQKSPIPPWPDRVLQPGEAPYCEFDSLLAADMPADFDYRPVPTLLERNAFNPQPVPGELFTRNPLRRQQQAEYDEQAANPAMRPQFQWNSDKEVCHDMVVARRDIVYNDHEWHDPDGHLFYLEAEGDPDGRPGPHEPLFFRAQHGQIVNVRLHNATPPVIEETPFDVRFPPCDALPWEGECSTHVHMVKFDPVCADGASVGWNYMSGPVIGKKMVYRWWADQEFGVIFFHDHLFANYRQKHGLFGGLLVEPAGATVLDPFADSEIVTGLQARVRRHPDDLSGPRWFREFCIAVADFIPMFDRDGRALNPPPQPGGHGDQGVMALSYRNEPIRERPGDPAFWFSSTFHGRDPATPLLTAFEEDPIWIRILQGSHEEQHSFQVHDLRWRRFRANLDSVIRNQQTLGLSEAFTFIVDEPVGRGDHLYKLSGADDLWLGCWGLIRVHRNDAARIETRGLLKLADSEAVVEQPTPEPLDGPELPAGATVRRFHVVAEPRRVTYRAPDLVDPFGLVYRLVSVTSPNGDTETVPDVANPEPLVLRCREGEYVQVTLENRLPTVLEPEPFAPSVPLEARDPGTFRPERPVSSHVSMHADLVRYDVRRSDGANVGRNPQQTVPPGAMRTYTWHAERPPAAPVLPGGEPANAGEPLGPVLLQDMADFRNHRHHGLIGALVIEAANVTPRRVTADENTAGGGAVEAWHGARATLVSREPGQPARREEEVVLLMQDGLRLFLRGNPLMPIPDEPPASHEDEPDHEDQGQKGFNYRSEPVGPAVGPGGTAIDWLNIDHPATPVWRVPVDRPVRFHLVGGLDKPRNQSFTIHGVAWPEWRFRSPTNQPIVASEGAISCGTARTFVFTPAHRGDHAYRSGVLKWAVPQGLWGILRVAPRTRPLKQ